MSGIDEILATYEGLRADQEAFYQDPNRHTGLSPPSTALPGVSPGGCTATGSRSPAASAARGWWASWPRSA